MARWIAFIVLTLVATGCSVRVQNGTAPRYDYSEYEAYGEQLGTPDDARAVASAN